MNILDALINQSPSLALQRAAADEISRLQSIVSHAYDLAWYIQGHELDSEAEKQHAFYLANKVFPK